MWSRGALYLLLICWTLTSATPSRPETDLLVGVVNVDLGSNTRDAFFDIIRNLADEHAFAIRIAPTQPDNQHFIIELWREDIKVLGVNPFDVQQFEIGIYENSVHAVPESIVREVADALRQSVSTLEGVTVSIKPK